MKKLIITAAVLLSLLSGCALKKEQPEPSESVTALPQEESVEVMKNDAPEAGKIGDDTPVSRALAAKMLALILGDKNSVMSLEREITFSDTTETDWYDKYINAVFMDGIMAGGGETFAPEEYVSINQAQMLIDRIDPENSIQLKISEDNKDKPISFALWTELLTRVMENMSGDKTAKEVFAVEEKKIIPLATKTNNDMLGTYQMITDKGPLYFEGLSMDEYIDKEIRVLLKGDEILSVISLETDRPTIRNAYISALDQETVTIFTGGVERVYSYPNNMNSGGGSIGHITIQDGRAEKLQILAESTSGIIKQVSLDEIELDGGTYTADEDMKIYDLSGERPRWKGITSLTVGSSIADFAVEDGRIGACLIRKTTEPDKIRVVLGVTGYSAYLHPSVTLTSEKNFCIAQAGQVTEYEAGQVLEFLPDDFQEERIYAYSNEEGGKITVNTISRNWPGGESPAYRGIIEVSKEEGGFYIVNELNLEEYLYSVVPSEMPASNGLEAAKVQAVTARSYAFNQYYANRYHKYGANVDDSVSCQVYNNIPENNLAVEAVDSTAKQCLVYGESVISANFFSTSAGVTSNSGEVWASSVTGQFPSDTPAYLRSVKQYSGDDYGDLSQEENARAFFMNREVKSYDENFNWFRWQTDLTAEELSASINQALKGRYEAEPRLIKTLQANGAYRSRPVESIGTVLELEVMRRGEGGNIMQLRIKGTEAEILVSTEYNIRLLLKPSALQLADGSVLENYSLMPSAFFVMEPAYDESGRLSRISFYGGGNGHGAGMSQNGVKGMVDAGFAFEEILKHYYSGTEVKKMF